METLFKIIKADFDSLWKMRIRGTTLEIITPFATTNDKFISVFVAKRGDDYVVTDGGWIYEGKYDSELPLLDDIYIRVFDYYKVAYGVNELTPNDYSIFYYKKTNNPSMISSLVFDLASFTNGVVSASLVNYQEKKEIENAKRFQSRANEFIKEIMPRDIRVKHNIWANEKFKSVRFNALIPAHNRLTLVSYVTGSKDEYFSNSLAMANMRFEVVEKGGLDGPAANKVLLIDDTVKSYTSPKLAPIISIITNNSNRVNLPWSEREKLKKVVGID